MRSSLSLSLAGAVVAVLASASASAAINIAAVTAGNTVDIGGSTAFDRNLFEALVDPTNGICASGGATESTTTPVVLTSASSFSPTGPANYAVVCNTRAAFGTVAAGTLIAVRKFSDGGSETGLDPVALGTTSISVGASTLTIQFVSATSTTGCTGGPTFVAATGLPNDRIAYVTYTGCPRTASAPQVGNSDVNPEVFGTAANVRNQLTWQGGQTLPFQIAVTQPFYEALKTKQGITCPGGAASAQQTDACLPSLSAAQVRGILAGQITSVSQIGLAPPTATGTGKDFSGAALDGSFMYLCLRSSLSGTRKAFEINFFDQGCQAAPSLTMLQENTVTQGTTKCNDVGCAYRADATTGNLPIDSTTGVFSGSSSGQVEACLSDLSNKNIYAVGILAADRRGTLDAFSTTSNKFYRTVKIDGSAPTLDNVIKQKYNIVVENVWAYPTGTSPNLAAYNTGNRAAIFQSVILNNLRNPALMAKTFDDSNNGTDYGRIGFLVRPATDILPTQTDAGNTRPVASATRQKTLQASNSTAAPVNNCVPTTPANATGTEAIIRF
jgi:hypothetical protein